MPQTPRRFALLGNFVPRQCGIATFTADLEKALSSIGPNVTVDVIAVSDKPDYEYPETVRFEIAEQDIESYQKAADFLNRGNYDALYIQHEYGIYGGVAGAYILNLVRSVKMPIITTLHTVLQEPSAAQKAVLDEILEYSERVVVMSKRAVDFLKQVHGVHPEKIDVIPHGIPDLSKVSGGNVRKDLGIEGQMILTFGLLSPDKGIETMIKAMPKILAKNPTATYVIVGATHPNIRASVGEIYRQGLIQLAEELGVMRSLRFVDKFVTKDELNEFLSAMDIYVTPYLNPKQITSGTLAYAVGAGKAVVSTPYWYAEELLADGRGRLVPFRDPDAMAGVLNQILGSELERETLGHEAAAYGKRMLWPAVAQGYFTSFEKAKSDGQERIRMIVEPTNQQRNDENLPELNLRHLLALSDDTGLIQHATHNVPNRAEGYCVDDNARALILTTYLQNEAPSFDPDRHIQGRYLGFTIDAFNPESKRFRNFMGYDRRWLEDAGSDDSHGRTLWGLGTMANRGDDAGRREAARVTFRKALTQIDEMTSPRSWAYAILGAHEYLNAHFLDQDVRNFMARTAKRLVDLFDRSASDDWPWFEQSLTYANARLCEALILAGASLDDDGILQKGLDSLRWLMRVQTNPEENIFIPIGSRGFYERGGLRSFFDQQPIEAAASVSACLSALRVTGEVTWAEDAERTFGWFLGRNSLRQAVYDPVTGGCYDGVHPGSLNQNQGAESTISYLTALCQIRESIEMRREARATQRPKSTEKAALRGKTNFQAKEVRGTTNGQS